MRKAGNQDKFYMFEQIAPSADQIWANAAVTIPGILYWASGSAPSETRWSPMDPNRSLNYYRAAEPYFNLSAPWKGARVAQPAFYMTGKSDGLKELYPLTVDEIRVGIPGLVGGIELDNVGHWIQHEAATQVSEQLIRFLRGLKLI
jgi:pimeloyl-ACP methyl ester carboxylesterase